MKEAGRRCQRCEFAWYATPPGTNPGKPRWFDEAGSFWTDGQARMARRTANYDRHLGAKDRWERCPNCGSRSVRTDKSRDFRPTGAISPTDTTSPPPSQPAPMSALVAPTTQQATPAASPGPSIWQQLGKFHARHWRIIWAVVFALAPFGSVGDRTDYGALWKNVLSLIGTFLLFWAIAAFFFFLHVRHQQKDSRST